MRLIYAASIAFSDKLANRVQIRVMAEEFQKKLGDNFCLGVNYKNIDSEKIKIICFNSPKSYVLAWRYLKFIKKNNIAYIYCREARLLFFLILFNKLFFHLKSKYIYELHSLLERNLTDKIVERFLSMFVSIFIFVNKNLRDIYFKKYSIADDKALVAPDGVDLNVFGIDLSKEEAKKRFNLPLDKKIIGYTGRFTTMDMDKGVKDILKALKILSDKEILFIAIGGYGKELDFYKSLAAQYGIGGQTILLGLHSQPDLAVYQKACDALLMPFPDKRHYAYYMSPLKMFEYMASKRPIIATDLPSIREVLSEKNAVIVKPDNPEDLARGIEEVLINKELAEKISAQAFIDAKKYTWEKRVEKILNAIG